MLAEYEQLQGRGAGAGAGPGQDSMAPEEKERLELYHASVDQDRLDHDLILKLLGHISVGDVPSIKISLLIFPQILLTVLAAMQYASFGVELTIYCIFLL